MKRGTHEHPKLFALSARLSIPLAHAAGLLELLWHWTARYAKSGDIGKFADDAIARGAGWEGEPEVFITALTETRWLDADKECRVVVHDWYDHAEDSVHMACARETHYIRTRNAWLRPKLARLGKDERAQVVAAYDTYERNAGKRTENAQETPGNALPSLAKPCQAMPEPSQWCAPTIETRIINGQSVTAPPESWEPITDEQDARRRAEVWMMTRHPDRRKQPAWLVENLGKLIHKAGWERAQQLVAECEKAGIIDAEAEACRRWDGQKHSELSAPKVHAVAEEWIGIESENDLPPSKRQAYRAAMARQAAARKGQP